MLHFDAKDQIRLISTKLIGSNVGLMTRTISQCSYTQKVGVKKGILPISMLLEPGSFLKLQESESKVFLCHLVLCQQKQTQICLPWGRWALVSTAHRSGKADRWVMHWLSDRNPTRPSHWAALAGLTELWMKNKNTKIWTKNYTSQEKN